MSQPDLQLREQLGATARVDSAGVSYLRRLFGRSSFVNAVLLPVGSVLGALLIGAVILLLQGVPVLQAYADVATGAFGSVRALSNTAVAATPLILIGLGVAIAYRAQLLSIGAEGQFLIGAVCAVAVVTNPGLAALPSWLIVVIGIVVAAAGGGAWSAISAWLNIRFKASVVITSLLLNYVAAAVLAWAVREGIPDPEAFTPQTRSVGDAVLPNLPGTYIHLGFLLALVAVAAVRLLLRRTRVGLRIGVMGANPEVLRANESSTGRFTVLILVLAGVLAGVAGYVEVAGVTDRITGAFSTGLGFTAIMVALLGRLHPVGVLIAAVLLAALDVGFGAAGRSLSLPSTAAEIVQASIVILFVVGGALLSRRQR